MFIHVLIININNECLCYSLTCTAVAPSLVADILDRDPRKEPIGVRTALTITTSFNLTLELYKRLLTKFI